MNVHHVNSTLSKAISLIQGGQLEEMASEGGESFGVPDNLDPDGDPIHGGAGGVANMSPEGDFFDAYIEEIILAVMRECSLGEDAAYQALVFVATQKAREGMIPPMPNVDTSSAEHLSTWAGAAKTAGLVGMVIEYCQQR